MSAKLSMKDELIAVLPTLRGFAMSLTRNRDAANDLVQQTLMKAWAHQEKFTRGTNIRAWTFTIMRNELFNQWRKSKLEVLDSDSYRSSRCAEKARQVESVSVVELRHALEQLRPEQREAIVLAGAFGFSYEEAAEICDVPLGTIKSRVNRARSKLSEMLPDVQSYEPEHADMTSSAISM